jgi:hypothetical protein
MGRYKPPQDGMGERICSIVSNRLANIEFIGGVDAFFCSAFLLQWRDKAIMNS